MVFSSTGIFPNLSENYLEVSANSKFKNSIVIMRSLRRQNDKIDYFFFRSYKNVVFLGLEMNLKV